MGILAAIKDYQRKFSLELKGSKVKKVWQEKVKKRERKKKQQQQNLIQNQYKTVDTLRG